ncbi:MAG: DUF4913 domain-containing protein [Propionibacteriaceae bacterium]|jgi:hypothetical protein|nr:DUF4913 domain-containing protein [Propionibacteriaceae bacterium]
MTIAGLPDEPREHGHEVEPVVDLNAPAEGGPPPMHETLNQFVEWLASWYVRKVDGRNSMWTSRWFDSAEVVIRMEAMWRAFESARLESGPAMSIWLKEHVDYHMTLILAPEGPLYAYGYNYSDQVTQGEPLPVIAPPLGMFSKETIGDRLAAAEAAESQ